MMSKQKQNKGFTLAELLVALMVMAIVLTAAATMAGALSSGKAANDQISRNGAYLLQVQSRLSDLIMRSNGVTAVTASADATYCTNITLWHDSDGDLIQDALELIQINREADGTLMIINGSNQESYGHCGNVRFYPDDTTLSSMRSIVVKWDMVENGVLQTYSICGTLRGKD
jgi:prepilin-type N-terminal cleavage/methylation domain-containing protein